MVKDIRRYRDEGDLLFELSVPPPDGLFQRMELQDQGLDIKLTRTPMNLWEVRVNPAGGPDVVFPMTSAPPPKDRLRIELKWKRGGHMVLTMNGRLIGSQPFMPPPVS